MKLSQQQSEAVSFASTTQDNFILEAVAGSGKTFTLLRIAEVLTGDVAFTAFNKEISLEITEKIKTIQTEANIKVGTRHSFGFGAIRRAFNVKVDANKLKTLARQEFSPEIIPFATTAARLAKASLPESYTDWVNMIEHFNLWELIPDKVSEDKAIFSAQRLLEISNNTTRIIDFEDMIYFPIVHNLRMWQYDVVLLDEAQDTNKAGRLLLKKMILPEGRIIAVGDPHQAIYGFTGASSQALREIANDFNAITLPLSVTYRCPKKIVNHAQIWVDHIQSAPESPEGEVLHQTHQEMLESVESTDAIICRNTRPLIETAYQLIRMGKSCKVEGRKIGEGLIKIITKWKRVKTVQNLENKLEEWAEKEIQKNKIKERNMICQEIEDKVATIKVFIDQCEPDDGVDILKEKINSLFGDSQGIQNKVILTTIHKAKGKEWNKVYALRMAELSPSKWAKKPWEYEQENNLCYVQVTRSKGTLVLVN